MKYLIILSLFALCGCDNPNTDIPKKMEMELGKDFHYLVPHGVGSKLENPSNGCPCVTLALGWSSYENKTNALSHGIPCLIDAFTSARKPGVRGLINLDDLYNFERELVKKWKCENE